MIKVAFSNLFFGINIAVNLLLINNTYFMKTTLLFTILSIGILSLLSCKKETVSQKRNLNGTWTYSKAERVYLFKKNKDIINDFDDIIITIDENDCFTWTTNNSTEKGIIETEESELYYEDDDFNNTLYGDDNLIFVFDNGEEIIFHEYRLRDKKTTLKYKSDNNDYKFELKKAISNTPRR